MKLANFKVIVWLWYIVEKVLCHSSRVIQKQSNFLEKYLTRYREARFTHTKNGSKYSRVDQVKLWKTAHKKISTNWFLQIVYCTDCFLQILLGPFLNTLPQTYFVNIRNEKPLIRDGSKTAATSKMDRFVIIVNGFQQITIITKRSILDAAAALGPPLLIFHHEVKFSKIFHFFLMGRTRGGSRTAATSKMELFMIIVNGRKPLTIITKCSILDVAAVLDRPLCTSETGTILANQICSHLRWCCKVLSIICDTHSVEKGFNSGYFKWI